MKQGWPVTVQVAEDVSIIVLEKNYIFFKIESFVRVGDKIIWTKKINWAILTVTVKQANWKTVFVG